MADTKSSHSAESASSAWKPGQGDAEQSLSPDTDVVSPDAESVFSQRSGIRDPLIKRGGEASPDDAREIPENDSASDIRACDERPLRPRPDVERVPDDEEAGEPSPQELRERHAQNLRARRRKKKRQVFWNRIRLVLKLGFALLWIAMLWELVQSPLWRLNAPRFTLENPHLLTRAQILPLIRPWMGKPLYDVDTGAVARRIQAQFPVVAHVAVRRRLFPARLDILLTEKTPWAELHALPPTETDAESAGLAQKPLAASAINGGLSFKGVHSSRPYALVAENTFIPLRGMAYHARLYPGHIVEPVILSPATRYSVRYIDMLRQFTWKARQLSGMHLLWTDARRPERVSLHFRETIVILGRLDHTAEERLVRLIPLIPKINELHGAIEAVDLRWEKQVTLHTRPNAPILPSTTAERTDG